MEGSSWGLTQGDPGMASGDTIDWRWELSVEARQRIVNKIMETLNKHLPISGLQGLYELNRIAARFEEKIFAIAISQADYLRKISLKMLAMESKSSNTNPLASNSAAGIQNAQDPGQGNQQNTSSVSQPQNQERLYGDVASRQQHQQQPKKQKRSSSHVMGKGKKCRISCALEEEILCAICLDPVLDNGDRSTAKLRCGHQFHLDCIGSAFNAKASMQCPTCRRVENGQWRFYHAWTKPL